eukprot:3369373-Alexandrium_andersonii.AAC.1
MGWCISKICKRRRAIGTGLLEHASQLHPMADAGFPQPLPRVEALPTRQAQAHDVHAGLKGGGYPYNPHLSPGPHLANTAPPIADKEWSHYDCAMCECVFAHVPKCPLASLLQEADQVRDAADLTNRDSDRPAGGHNCDLNVVIPP